MCDENCSSIKSFIREYKYPLYAVIDNSYHASKEVLRCYRKSVGLGFEIRKLYKITDQLYQDIIDIYTSKVQRQGRDINYLYHLTTGGSHDLREGWPHTDYSVFACSSHYFDFYGCFLGDKMVAFLELLHSNDLASTYSTMGHADYLNQGIMKFMFLEVIRQGNFKYLHYGDRERNVGMKYFLSDLGIINCNPEFIYSISENEST